MKTFWRELRLIIAELMLGWVVRVVMPLDCDYTRSISILITNWISLGEEEYGRRQKAFDENRITGQKKYKELHRRWSEFLQSRDTRSDVQPPNSVEKLP